MKTMHDTNTITGTDQTQKVDNHFIIYPILTFSFLFDCSIVALLLLSEGVEGRKAGQPSFPIHLVRLTVSSLANQL